jgi:hypothetical protein
MAVRRSVRAALARPKTSSAAILHKEGPTDRPPPHGRPPEMRLLVGKPLHINRNEALG